MYPGTKVNSIALGNIQSFRGGQLHQIVTVLIHQIGNVKSLGRLLEQFSCRHDKPGRDNNFYEELAGSHTSFPVKSFMTVYK